MHHLNPIYTKARIYLQKVKAEQRAGTTGLLEAAKSKSFDAVCEIQTCDGSSIIEVIALKDIVHRDLIPLATELVPGAFITLEAVCAIKVPNTEHHDLYRQV